MEGTRVTFTVAGGARFVRRFPSMTPEQTARYLNGSGLRSVLRNAGHYQRHPRSAYEIYDSYPSCSFVIDGLQTVDPDTGMSAGWVAAWTKGTSGVQA